MRLMINIWSVKLTILLMKPYQHYKLLINYNIRNLKKQHYLEIGNIRLVNQRIKSISYAKNMPRILLINL